MNTKLTHLIISAYSLSFPLLSLHFLNITEASTLAGEKVLGSLSSEITLRRIVLKRRQKNHVRKDSCFCLFLRGGLRNEREVWLTSAKALI